ncbi:hypothetical protein PGTUg99_031444 [Puccinia graminis f. sp. tritici]|uniref:Uncharacterized protein n=1 Tax=Puccinia graminis f. sp. tritici TaxID=56615 RepID=A0A5B0PK19_PUCGR|nr:hypothetical protein PGTUg99_031444 [Puccinia graminis f. sp. tritici]
MPQDSTYHRYGTLSSSTRTRNKYLSPQLPSHGSPLCQALHQFTRLLLGITKNSDPPPSSPNPAQLAQFHSGWRSNTFDDDKKLISEIATRIATTNSASPPHCGKKKSLNLSHRNCFLEHLKTIKFPHDCFNWHEACSSAWNEALTNLILKHWNHAYVNGSFLAYPLDPGAAGDPLTITALIHQWFDGRRDVLLQEQRNPGSAQKKSQMIQRSRWRKTLSEHRTETLKRMKVDEKFHGIFEDPLCNSDTEKQEDGTLVKVKLPWRSTVATSLAARIDRLTIQRKKEENKRSFGPSQLLETPLVSAILVSPPAHKKFQDPGKKISMTSSFL